MPEAMQLLAAWMPTETDPWRFLLIGSLAAIVFGMGKVGFGGGIGILAVPMMIYSCGDASFAIGLMLPLLILADYAGMLSWLGRWDRRGVRALLPGVAMGILAGGLILWRLRDVGQDKGISEAALKFGVGVIALSFVFLQLLQWRMKRDWVFRPVPWQATLAGGVVGLTSTFAHAAGPVAGMYLLSQRMDKERFVATTVLLFWIVNQLKLIPYSLLGLIRTDTLQAGAIMIPSVLLGAVLGKWLNRKLGQTHFTGIVYALLAAAGVDFLYEGGKALLAAYHWI
jgi:hypothetical protein